MRHSSNQRWLLVSLVTTFCALEAPALASAAEIVNPGFEADGTGVAAPTGWESTGAVNADYTEWGGHTGNYRLSHWSAAAFWDPNSGSAWENQAMFDFSGHALNVVDARRP